MKMTRWWVGDAMMVREIDVGREMVMMDVFGRGRGWGFLRVSVEVEC